MILQIRNRVILSILFLFFCTCLAVAQVPDTINYQGYLADDGGIPLEGDHLIQFNIYDAETDGTSVWNEQQTVTLSSGIFNVQLGAELANSLTIDIFATPDLFLDIQIFKTGTGWESFEPRQKLTSVPFAFKAADSDTLGDHAPSYFSVSTHEHDAAYVNEGQAGSVQSSMILDNSVTSSDLAANSVGSSEISANAVATAELANNAVTLSKLADNSVGSNEIIDDSVTFEDIKDGSGSKLDADSLDGHDSPYFMTAGTDNWVNTTGDSMTGALSIAGDLDVLNSSASGTNYIASFESIGGKYASVISAKAIATTGSARGLYVDASSDSSYVYGVESKSSAFSGSSSTVQAFKGESTHAGTGDLYGLYSDGTHTGTSGDAFGVRSWVYGSDTGDTKGIYSLARKTSTDTDGTVWGGHFIGDNDRSGGYSYGVLGEATGLAGHRYGVYGKVTTSDNSSNYGVYSEASSASGNLFGFYANVDSDGYNYVRGAYLKVDKSASATGGVIYGLEVDTDNNGASAGGSYGIYNDVQSQNGAVWGIFNKAYSNGDGSGTWAILSDAYPSNTGPGYGGYFRSHAYTGYSGDSYGIKAEADGDTSGRSYGGYFSTSGTGLSDYAGYFSGKVRVYGNLEVSGTVSKGGGSFKIDHPLDPENKYLQHSFVESPDMKNIYDGMATLNDGGEVWVDLPNYFNALNRDFRYQLTAIGAPGPNLYISKEITGNRFQIAGGTPGMKVSWMVTGIRQDAWANANRIQIEVEKETEEKGSYLHPEAFDLEPQRGINFKNNIPEDAGLPAEPQ